MTRTQLSNLSIRTGGFIGGVSFLVFGLGLAVVYGGFTGVLLASALAGGPVGAELGTRILVGLSMLFGVLATGAFFTLVGALAGAFFDVFVVGPIYTRVHRAAPADVASKTA